MGIMLGESLNDVVERLSGQISMKNSYIQSSLNAVLLSGADLEYAAFAHRRP